MPALIERKNRKERTLAPVRPNLGLELEYRRELDALIAEMNKSVLWFVRAAYRKDPPAMAQDSAADTLRAALKKLSDRWERRFNDAAKQLAEWFATAAADRSDRALKAILRKAGFTVRFKPTPEVRDILKATIAENVSLIKSIPNSYFTQVEGSVYRSVTAGRDLGTLTKELQTNYGVTRRRAAAISRDQNNKATAVIQRTRQTALGITEAVWLHSTAGRVPRKTHLANNGKRYRIADGWHDPDPKVSKPIWPGELINCRCVAKPIVPGFS